jgi:hypothetical protein
MPHQSNREKARKHIDKKLRNRLRMYFVISIVLLGVVVYEAVSGLVPFTFALLGVIVGILLGIVTARMFHLSWNKDAKKIVSRLDMFGGIILVFYIIFAFYRGKIVGHFIHGSAVGGVSISIVTGIMIGRVLGTRGRIIQILKEQKVF